MNLKKRNEFSFLLLLLCRPVSLPDQIPSVLFVQTRGGRRKSGPLWPLLDDRRTGDGFIKSTFQEIMHINPVTCYNAVKIRCVIFCTFSFPFSLAEVSMNPSFSQTNKELKTSAKLSRFFFRSTFCHLHPPTQHKVQKTRLSLFSSLTSELIPRMWENGLTQIAALYFSIRFCAAVSRPIFLFDACST